MNITFMLTCCMSNSIGAKTYVICINTIIEEQLINNASKICRFIICITYIYNYYSLYAFASFTHMFFIDVILTFILNNVNITWHWIINNSSFKKLSYLTLNELHVFHQYWYQYNFNNLCKYCERIQKTQNETKEISFH